MRKFQITPEQTSYSVRDGLETVSTKLDGGAARYRKDILNSNTTVEVSWSLDPSEYEYFKAFYKNTTKSGALPFLIDLIIDEALELTEHEAYFVPDTVTLSSTRGLGYFVSCELDVKPINYASEYQDAIVFLFENFGSDQQKTESYFNTLNNLVNIQLPSLPVF